MKVILCITILIAVAFPAAVISQGFGCEANLPDPIRTDCHPEAGSSDSACRARNCTWCPAENDGFGYPWCFYPSDIPPGPLPGFGCEENYLPDEDRVDCYPESGASELACRQRNCTWCPASNEGENIPWCYISGQPSMGGYLMVGEPIYTATGVRVNLQRAVPDPRYSMWQPRWDGEAETLNFVADFQSDYRLHVKIDNPDDVNRWEVPLQIHPTTGGSANLQYEIQFENDPLFSFKVVRKSNNAVLFDSNTSGRFIYAEQYMTLSWKPASNNVYGVGENEQPTFRHDFSRNLSWGLWARDQPPDFTANMYGVQPYYTVLEEDGNAHSVAIINSNAQEFSMLSGPVIKYTTVGGVFDFYFFLGPTPENTVQQYTEMVGRAQLPPYWGLGFQLCRYGYNNIADMQAVVDRTASYSIPHDVQYGDIDIMDRELDFTYSRDRFPGLPEYILDLKRRGIKFMTILDPCISMGEPAGSYRPFELGNEMDVWVMKADGTPVVGKVWPADPIHFPDYSKNSTREWWITLIREFHDLLAYDGLWIDMNEPANFVDGDVNEGCPVNKYNNPPYVPKIIGRYLPSKTICADHVDSLSLHYNTHSLYGWLQSEPTLAATRAGTGKRALVLSRSTFLGSGQWVAHWLGDNWSRWSNLHFSIIGVLQYNQFGVPFVGSDICGFIGESNAAMCQRWMELGAFYPFSRNHNGLNYAPQDPAYFGANVAISSRNVLNIRYTLLPYLYTLFYLHRTEGNTVARALWHEFPTDSNTHGIDRQFLWGSGFLISPVLDEGALSVEVYFPDARFFSYHDGAEVSVRGGTVNIPAPMEFIPLHIRGGNILPTQQPAINTEISRNNPFGLIVALDDNGSAKGSLFYDDGDSIDSLETNKYFYATYEASNRSLRATVVRSGYDSMGARTLETIRLLGAGPVTQVTVNGVAHTDFSTLPSGEVVLRSLRINASSEYTITY